MTKRGTIGRPVAIGSSALLVALAMSACSGTTSSTQSREAGATATFQVFAEPDDKGAAVLSAINSAKVSIDIPIYSIGGDPNFDGALAAAKQRGVNVRVMMNGGYGAYVPGAQSFTKALLAAPGTGTAKVNWSSNNFSITHQKSVIVDAADASGAPLDAKALPTATAQLVISTGNFNGFKGSSFYLARDYALVTKDPKLITTVESAFASDFGCAGSTVINPANLTVADRLVWSNGTTGANAGQTGSYPPGGNYPPPSALAAGAQNQGNAKSEWLAVIQGAKPGDVLRVTNEEMSDTDVINALVAAAKSGVDVRVIMTMPDTTKSSGAAAMAALNAIASAGPKSSVHLFAKADSVLYIHSKFAAINGSDAVVGSQNFSQTSMQLNRELGVRLGAEDQSAIAVLAGTFDTDWAVTANVTVLPGASPAPSTAPSRSAPQKQSLADAGAPPQGTTNQKCGPI
ncbi:MAG: phospholipase D-like domain-containing protein, partial [Actinomycetes bacterium]